jgi:capsular exopolysaccharide synthesis family protein
MIPRTIVARPEDLEPPPARSHAPDPDILPLPGSRRPQRDPHVFSGPVPPPRPLAAPEIGPRDILNALRYHSVLFVTLGTLVAGGLFAAGWLLVPGKYTTYATLFVDQRNPTVMPSVNGMDESGNFATYLKTQANLIKNRKITGGALLDPAAKIGLLPMLRNQDDPAAFLEEKLLIEVNDTSKSDLRVTLSGDDPVQITAIVNAVVDYYMKEVTAWRVPKIKRIETLQRSKDELEKSLAAKWQHFEQDLAPGGDGEPKTFKQKLRMSEYLGALQQRNAARAGLNNARSALKTAQIRLEQHDANPPTVPVADLNSQIEADAAVRVKDLVVRRIQRDRDTYVQQSSRPNAARLAELNQRLATATADLEEARQKARTKVETDYRGGLRAQLTANIDKCQDEMRYREEQERVTIEQLAEYKEFKDLDEIGVQKKMSEIGKQNDEIQNLRREVARVDSSITSLKLDLDAPDRVRIWHKAEVPSKKDIRKQAAVSGAAGLFGLGLVGGLISLYELRKKRVYGPTDTIFRSKLPLLGCIPECAAPATAKGDTPDPAGRSFFEAVDKVKAVLCRQLQRRKMQAVLVTSTARGEGKSALAWHLALSLARSDRRTLFIDGNLRNPGLHNHFDIASHPGLSELLRGERMMQEVVQRTALDNLWCVAAGICDDVARQALDKDSLRTMLDRARRDFDYIVIDSCSIRESVDPLYLAQRADATVLAVRSFQSCTADVDRACDRLTQLGTPLLGAVLTDPSGAGCDL